MNPGARSVGVLGNLSLKRKGWRRYNIQSEDYVLYDRH
jgi:hypothetical protein